MNDFHSLQSIIIQIKMCKQLIDSYSKRHNDKKLR